MTERSRGLLFRKRNILGLVLAAGIGMGIYLGQFKGLFFGSGNNFGIGTNDAKAPDSPLTSTEVTTDAPATAALTTVVPDVVKVIIDEHQFLLRNVTGDEPITLPNLIQLIKKAPGDYDGFRVRIYEKSTARVSSEEKLKTALAEGGIPDNAVLWVPTPVKD